MRIPSEPSTALLSAGPSIMWPNYCSHTGKGSPGTRTRQRVTAWPSRAETYSLCLSLELSRQHFLSLAVSHSLNFFSFTENWIYCLSCRFAFQNQESFSDMPSLLIFQMAFSFSCERLLFCFSSLNNKSTLLLYNNRTSNLTLASGEHGAKLRELFRNETADWCSDPLSAKQDGCPCLSA